MIREYHTMASLTAVVNCILQRFDVLWIISSVLTELIEPIIEVYSKSFLLAIGGEILRIAFPRLQNKISLSLAQRTVVPCTNDLIIITIIFYLYSRIPLMGTLYFCLTYG